MRVLITGSRDLTDTDLVHDALTALWEQNDELIMGDFTVVHGGARGADAMAAKWCELMRHYGVHEDVYQADWKTHGRAAGPIRNQQMINTGPNIVLAFYKEGVANIGTRHCVNAARKAGITVQEKTQA